MRKGYLNMATAIVGALFATPESLAKSSAMLDPMLSDFFRRKEPIGQRSHRRTHADYVSLQPDVQTRQVRRQRGRLARKGREC